VFVLGDIGRKEKTRDMTQTFEILKGIDRDQKEI
jgi:hypothetical protein